MGNETTQGGGIGTQGKRDRVVPGARASRDGWNIEGCGVRVTRREDASDAGTHTHAGMNTHAPHSAPRRRQNVY